MYILKITFQTLQYNKQLRRQILQLKKNYKFNKIKISGIISIKKRKKIFTVLKSPNINKKSREQFSFQNYNQKIEIKSYKILELLNILITIKSIIIQNTLFKIKIIKRKKR